MLWILFTLASASTPVQFHPGSGPGLVEIDASGRIDGVPVALTGTVLARASDPSAIAALPEVAEVRHSPGAVLVVIPAPGVEPAALSRALHDRADVRWAHPDLRVQFTAHYMPDDPYLDEQWHLENIGQHGYRVGADIHATDAWELTAGAGQLIAVIDTGTDPTHPDLDVILGYDYVDDDPDSTPIGDDAHGTACAGLAAGLGDNGVGTAGVAYEAQVYSIRLIGNTSLNDMYSAFVEAVDAGASVLNNSWGFGEGCTSLGLYGVVEEALDYAEANGRDGLGTAVVFSAGNGNCDITEDGMQSHYAAISVAASDGNDIKEGYSSFGPWVDITAPSGNIATADIVGPNGYDPLNGDNSYTGTFSGTSASAPEISGTLALMFSVNDRLTAQEARDALCATAVKIDLLDGDWDETGWSPYYGCGRVDAGAAVRAVYNLGPPEIPVPLGPKGEAEGPGAVLTWGEALDPDGDWVRYKVRYWYPDHPELDEVALDSDRPWLELPEEIAGVGATISWKVRAIDPWGAGEWSPEASFTVVKASEPTTAEPRSCQTTAGSTPIGAGLWLAALIGLRRRRTAR